jgi:hypothetical protein
VLSIPHFPYRATGQRERVLVCVPPHHLVVWWVVVGWWCRQWCGWQWYGPCRWQYCVRRTRVRGRCFNSYSITQRLITCLHITGQVLFLALSSDLLYHHHHHHDIPWFLGTLLHALDVQSVSSRKGELAAEMISDMVFEDLHVGILVTPKSTRRPRATTTPSSTWSSPSIISLSGSMTILLPTRAMDKIQ